MSDFNKSYVGFLSSRMSDFYKSDVGFLQVGCRIFYKSDVECRSFKVGCRMAPISFLRKLIGAIRHPTLKIRHPTSDV